MFDCFTPKQPHLTRLDFNTQLAPHVWVRWHLRECFHVQHMQLSSSTNTALVLLQGVWCCNLGSAPRDLQRSPFRRLFGPLMLSHNRCTELCRRYKKGFGEMEAKWCRTQTQEFLQGLHVNIDEATDVPAAMQLRSPSAPAGGALLSWQITAPWLNPEHIKHQVNTNHLEGCWVVSKWL